MADAAEVIELWRHVNAPRSIYHCGECDGSDFEITDYKADPGRLKLIYSACRTRATGFDVAEIEP